MYGFLQVRRTCIHVSFSLELQIGHVMEGNLMGPKNNCFMRFPMYCPVRNFIRLVFCAFVINYNGVFPEVS